MPRHHLSRRRRIRCKRCLSAAFEQQPALQSYVLDEQGCVRKHVAVFLNGRLLHDRKRLDVPLAPDDRIYIAQALSGG